MTATIRLVSRRAAAMRRGVTPHSLDQWIRKGKVRAYRFPETGRQVFVNLDDVDAYPQSGHLPMLETVPEVPVVLYDPTTRELVTRTPLATAEITAA
jgi:hypothetical protein